MEIKAECQDAALEGFSSPSRSGLGLAVGDPKQGGRGWGQTEPASEVEMRSRKWHRQKGQTTAKPGVSTASHTNSSDAPG